MVTRKPMLPVRIAAALVLLASIAIQGGCGRGRADSRPSVLLVVVDTLRADRLGAYGFPRPTSPTLDALAARGVRLDGLRTAAPSTLASFTSMLTGRYPHTHGVYRNGIGWPEGLEGMQSVFADAGYATAAFVSSYCLASEFGIARGFEHFDDELTESLPDLPSNKLVRSASEVTAAAAAWLEKASKDARPFFAMVHYFDPHWPYRPPPPYDRMFDPAYDGPFTGTMADLVEARRRLAAPGGRPDVDTDHLVALHLGEIRYTDDQIGVLLGTLDASGLAGRTLVVVTADHGETFYEHSDHFDHGLSVYDSNLRIPLIAVGPGIGGGRVVDGPLSNIDLAPTLLEFAGIAAPSGYEGRSFLPALRGEAPPESPASRTVYSEATKPHAVGAVPAWPNRLDAHCAVRGRFKLLRTPWRGTAWELYDLADDPDEQRDLAPASPAGVDLASWLQELEAWSSRRPPVLGSEVDDSDAVRERLRSLGYVR